MSPLEQHAEGLIAARHGEICIAIWRLKPNSGSFSVQRAMLEETVAAHPGKAKFLCIVEADAPTPDEDIRKASADMVNHHGDKLSKVACVIEGDGFKAAITRTVLTGIGMLVRNRVRSKFFATVASAATWLLESDGPRAASDLEAQVRELRQRLDGVSA